MQDIQTLMDNGANISFNPQRELVKVSGVTLSPQNLSLSLNQSYSLSSNTSPYNATNKNVSWKSSDETVATVDEKGLVTAVSKGEVIITATTQDGDFQDTSKVIVFSDEVVNFPDPNFEALVRDRIQKETGEILKSDLIGDYLLRRFQ